MEYVVSHLPAIFGAAAVVAVCAVLYWVSLEKSAQLKRQRAEVRKKEALKRREEQQNSDDKNL